MHSIIRTSFSFLILFFLRIWHRHSGICESPAYDYILGFSGIVCKIWETQQLTINLTFLFQHAEGEILNCTGLTQKSSKHDHIIQTLTAEKEIRSRTFGRDVVPESFGSKWLGRQWYLRARWTKDPPTPKFIWAGRGQGLTPVTYKWSAQTKSQIRFPKAVFFWQWHYWGVGDAPGYRGPESCHCRYGPLENDQ